MLVHGDVHQWNTLRADHGWKLVDPDGLVAEPEYDLGVMMREDPVELGRQPDPRAWAHRLARLTGTDPEAIWEWGVVERVSTGLLCLEIDLQPVGDQMLATADWIARQNKLTHRYLQSIPERQAMHDRLEKLWIAFCSVFAPAQTPFADGSLQWVARALRNRADSWDQS